MATIRLILNKTKQKNDGSCPVLLCVTHERRRAYFSTDFSVLEKDWNPDTELFRSSYPNHKKRNRWVTSMRFKAEDIIQEYKEDDIDWTIDDFKEAYVGVKTSDVFDFFNSYIQDLRDIGKVGNAEAYNDSYRALRKFWKGPLKFSQIDYPFLLKFEMHLRKGGAGDGGINTYMRTLRSLFNKAIKSKLCKEKYYPFKEYQIKKVTPKTPKRAIAMEDILKIAKYEATPHTKEGLSRDLFMFSFYTQGMNYIDMAKLKWNMIAADRLHYRRSKTGGHFSIKILPPVQKILDYYKNEKIGKGDMSPYIFPILDDSHKTEADIKERCKNGLKRMNKHLKMIGVSIGLNQPLTSYVARHSYATILKRKGVNISVISEGLGHTTQEVTQIYLDSFENETLDRANELLL